MKRILPLILCLVMVFGLAACGENPPTNDETMSNIPQDAPATEYERAFWYGIAPESMGKDKTRQITEKEMVDLLGTMIELRQGDLDGWNALTKGASGDMIYRDYGAMLILYTAELMGATEFSLDMRYPHFSQPGYIHEDYGAFFSDHRGNYTLLEVGGEKDARAICHFVTEQIPPEDDAMHYMSACKVYLASRISLVTGAMLMDFDYDTFTFHLTEPLTVEDALVSLTRLMESFPDVAAQLPETEADTAKASAWLQEAKDKRDAIINSATAIVKSDTFTKGETYTGTAYYVSNDGDDSADGTTPETAWATIDRVNSANLQYGDAVFFRRGDLWRKVMIRSVSGVTYSAYGEGAKPKFYGSEENGGGADKWTLYHEGAGGEKIWLYANDMLDTGAIVMNGGEAVAEKADVFWGGEYYQIFSDLWHTGHDAEAAEDQSTQPAFDPKVHLTEDMTYFSQADSHLPATLPAYLLGWNAGTPEGDMLCRVTRGPVYLRCDSGNPGELYADIEFLSPYGAFDGLAKDAVVDNIDFAYSGTNHVSAVGEGTGGAVIQNCCLGWVGGCTASYSLEYVTTYSAGSQRNGGAIGAGSSGNTVRNNYIYETYQEGITIETAVEFTANREAHVTDILLEGNVLYHSVSPLLYCNWDEEENPNHQYKNITIRDNYAMFTAMSPWTDMALTPGAFTSGGGPNMQDGTVKIENNMLFASGSSMVYIDDYVAEYFPAFSGNRFAQFGDRFIVRSGSTPTYTALHAQEAINFLEDETAEYLRLNRANWDDTNW